MCFPYILISWHLWYWVMICLTLKISLFILILWYCKYPWNGLVRKSSNKLRLSEGKCHISYIYIIDILLRVSCPILNKFEWELLKVICKKTGSSISLNWCWMMFLLVTLECHIFLSKCDLTYLFKYETNSMLVNSWNGKLFMAKFRIWLLL